VKDALVVSFRPVKRFLLAFIFFSCTCLCAKPATPEQVAAECERQMSTGICITRPDRSTISPGQTMLLSGFGRVSYSAYLDYLDLYNPKFPSDPAMCKLALHYMKTQPGGDHDKIARAMWSPSSEALAKESAESARETGIKVALLILVAVVVTLIGRRHSN